MAEIHLKEQVTPTTPQGGKLKLFVDSTDSRVKQIDSTGLVKDLTDSAAPSDNCRIGWADYDDLVTATTPISVTGGGGEVVLTNDAVGPQTEKTFLPTGVTDVWDTDNDTFDWTELSVGDMVDIRLAIIVTTTVVNTAVSVDLHMGSGGGAFTIPFITDTNFKSSGAHALNRFNGIFIGSTDVLNSGGQFKIQSDQNCTVEVIGWYTKILIRGA